MAQIDPDFVNPHRFGYVPDTRDRRDRLMFKAVPSLGDIPQRRSMLELVPKIYDQNVIGQCTGAAAMSSTYAVMDLCGLLRPFYASAPFIYRQGRYLGGVDEAVERGLLVPGSPAWDKIMVGFLPPDDDPLVTPAARDIIDRYVAEDGGAQIRNVLKAMNKWGLPPLSNFKPRYEPRDMPDEDTWIFPPQSQWRRTPPPSVFADAERRQVTAYYRLEGLNDLLACLAKGMPAIIGIPIYRSFYSMSHGRPLRNIPMPQSNERLLGWHAIMAGAYDLEAGRVTCRNSWGEDAHEGTPDFDLPFAYVQTFARDCWTATFIEGGKVH